MVSMEGKQWRSDVFKVAAASSDGIVVNQHFGRADTFYIYEVEEAGRYRLLEKRTVPPVCSGGNHDDGDLRRNADRFRDCKYIMVSRIGMGAANILEESGVIPLELPGMIEESMDRMMRHHQIQNLF